MLQPGLHSHKYHTIMCFRLSNAYHVGRRQSKSWANGLHLVERSYQANLDRHPMAVACPLHPLQLPILLSDSQAADKSHHEPHCATQ